MSTISDYLRLMRISLLPTAWSNVALGFALTVLPDAQGHWLALAGLAIASSCLYISGMVLNDVFDVEIDRIERPERVLPSGRIPLATAKRFGFLLIVAGVAFAAVVQWIQPEPAGPTLIVALVLATLILAYNLGIKRTNLGPFVMGACRSTNVLLGASLVPWAIDIAFVPLALGLYVAGITFLARDEATVSRRINLTWGALLMVLAAALLIVFPFTPMFFNRYLERHGLEPTNNGLLYVGVLLIMLVPVVRKVSTAWMNRTPSSVKQAVITSLLTMIMLDASVCYLASPSTPAYALTVASLIVPAFLMTRPISPT